MPVDQRALERVWRPLADKLDVHAYIEEKIFYPQLLQRGTDGTQGETLDAIGDHNEIRDGVRDANAVARYHRRVVGGGRANRPGQRRPHGRGRAGRLEDFRRHAPIGLREALGRQYREFMAQHPAARGCRSSATHPGSYVEEQRRDTVAAQGLLARYWQLEGRMTVLAAWGHQAARIKLLLGAV